MKNFAVIIIVLIFSCIQLYGQVNKQKISPQPREYYERLEFSAVFTINNNSGIVLESSRKLEKFAYILNNDLRLAGKDTLQIYYDTPPSEITRPIYLGIRSTKLNNMINKREEFNVTVTENYPGPEGYIIDIMPMNCTINASDSAGLYFGIKTFVQLVKKSDGNNIFACRIVDAPEFPIRWVYYPMNFLVDANVVKTKTQWQQFSDLKLNGAICGDVKYEFITEMPQKYKDSLRSTKQFADERFFNFVPAIFSFGYSNSLMFFNPNFASGLPVRGQKFYLESDTARLVPSVDVAMSNGGFENYNGNNFPGYQYIDQPGVLSFADTEIKYSGNVSVRFENFDVVGNRPNARVVYKSKVSPFKQYKVSCRVKTENLIPSSEIHLTILNTKGKQLNYANTNIPATTGDWKKIEVAINSFDNDTLLFYWGVWGAQSGRIWWDDLSVEECSFVNLLRRDGTPLTVDNPLIDAVIREGVDFDTLRDPKLGTVNSWYGDFDTYHQGPALKIKNGVLHNGDSIFVSYCHAITVYDGQVMVTMTDDNLYKQLETQFSIVDSILKPKFYMMNHDEIRTMNWDDGDLQKQMTPAELLAENTNRCYDLIKKYNSGADVWDWSDMYDEFHNAVKKDYYLVNGDLTGSADLINNNIGMVNWNSGANKVLSSLNFFSGKGFKQISAPYYDSDENHIRIWKNNTKNTTDFQGMVYTTWQKNYSHIQHFAEYAWNHAPYITHQPIKYVSNSSNNLVFNCTIEGDKYYQNWELDKVGLYYKTKQTDSFTRMQPSNVSNNDFEFNLDISEKTDYFSYYIDASDKDGWITKVPFGENQTYEYFLNPDNVSENKIHNDFQLSNLVNSLIMKNSSENDCSVNICDLSGKPVYSIKLISGQEISVPVSIFKDAVYVIKIVGKTSYSTKFIKIGEKLFFE